MSITEIYLIAMLIIIAVTYLVWRGLTTEYFCAARRGAESLRHPSRPGRAWLSLPRLL